MDQIKIGKFISYCRKEKQLTQAQLAEKLNITDRAISKWETGKGMPDSSIMQELCGILGISVNELFCGERISVENYTEKAEENLVEMKKEKEAASKAARFSFGITMILLVVLNACNIYMYGVQEAISMPAFIIMLAVCIIWNLIYLSVMNGTKQK